MLTGEASLTADIAERQTEWYGYMLDPIGWASMPCDDNPGTMTLLGGVGLGKCYLVGDSPIMGAGGEAHRELQFQGLGYPPWWPPRESGEEHAVNRAMPLVRSQNCPDCNHAAVNHTTQRGEGDMHCRACDCETTSERLHR